MADVVDANDHWAGGETVVVQVKYDCTVVQWCISRNDCGVLDVPEPYYMIVVVASVYLPPPKLTLHMILFFKDRTESVLLALRLCNVFCV